MVYKKDKPWNSGTADPRIQGSTILLLINLFSTTHVGLQRPSSLNIPDCEWKQWLCQSITLLSPEFILQNQMESSDPRHITIPRIQREWGFHALHKRMEIFMGRDKEALIYVLINKASVSEPVKPVWLSVHSSPWGDLLTSWTQRSEDGGGSLLCQQLLLSQAWNYWKKKS